MLHRLSSAASPAQWYPFDSGMFFSASVDGRVTLWQPESAEVQFVLLLGPWVVAWDTSRSEVGLTSCLIVYPLARAAHAAERLLLEPG